MIASGACNRPAVPAFANAVPASIEQLTPFDYRNPGHLAEGGVLVVGASATGVQLAAELQRSGRPVTLSVGEHVRLPRTYRGRDVLWWMDASGIWDQRYDEIDDLTRARRLPSPQLVGTPERDTLDLNALTAMGVEFVGRWADVRDGRALFSGGLRNMFTLADLKMGRLLGTFDEWARGARARRRCGRSGALWRRPACQRRPGCSLTCAAANPHDRVGDGFPPRLPVARRARARSEGPAAPRGWRGRRAGAVRAGASRATQAQVHFYPRDRGRRSRGRRSPGGISGRGSLNPTAVGNT